MTYRRRRRRWNRFVPLLLAFGCSWDHVGYAAHACALVEDGSVWCWGYNEGGQLGDGTKFDRARPAPVVGLPSARSIAAGGAFTCASTTDGAAYCWGNGELGQLGDGGTVDRATPAPVPGVAGVDRVFGGIWGACAILETGAVWCWGGGPDHGVAAPVTGLPSAAVDLAVESPYACAALADGEVWCWSDDHVAAPSGLTGAVAVAFGPPEPPLWQQEPCALLQGGAVSCFTLPAPALAISGSAYAQICALLPDGVVSCWGEERFGKFDSDAPGPFGPEPFTSGATAVSVGFGFACAVLATGDVECWGDNWGGQLGDGTDVGRLTAEPVSGLPGPALAVTAARGALVTPGGCGESERP